MKQTKCNRCGTKEFVTKPNWYEVYEIIEGQLCYIKKELIDEKFEIYCRNCSAKISNK